MVSRHRETLHFASSSEDLKFCVVKSYTNFSSQDCSCLNKRFQKHFFVNLLGVYIAEDHQQ